MSTTVIATHAVGNIDTWLKGGEERTAIFKNFCRSYRVFRYPNQAKVSLVFEDVDMAKMEAGLKDPSVAALKTKHTVIEPIEVQVELANTR
jgi:hypothetical protein